MVKTAKYLNATKKHLALISPLDWGLGHTTRCIPLIRQLQRNNFEIVIACNSVQKSVLKSEFPDVIYEDFDGYNLFYGKSRWQTLLRLFLQVPNILISIKRENLQIRQLIRRHQPDLILCDNRYGFRSATIHSIIITHQLQVLTGFGKLANRIVNATLHKMIRQFDDCWVPDFEGTVNLGGEISHPPTPPKFPVQYIGPLSRFAVCEDSPGGTGARGGYVLAVLSGPEPQRSILERMIIDQASGMPEHRLVLVRGTTATPGNKAVPYNIEIIDLAGSEKLNQLICDATAVISRAGYTSIMDHVKLKKKMILVPTPGQAEQEYLAKTMGKKKMAVVMDQAGFDLSSAIRRLNTLVITDYPAMNEYKKVCDKNFIFKRTAPGTDVPAD